MHALDGLALLSQRNGTHETGLLALFARCAEILMKYHASVRFSLQSARGTGSHTRRILAAATYHHPEVALNSSLGHHLDGAVL